MERYFVTQLDEDGQIEVVATGTLSDYDDLISEMQPGQTLWHALELVTQ